VIREAQASQRFIAHCEAAQSPEGKRYLPEILGKGGEVMILIGPEGDFSPEEITFALANGFREISLGTQRLRTETAAVVAVVMTAVANN
jgi:16S rRNA (uracil1498-N3)-methyltransferase